MVAFLREFGVAKLGTIIGVTGAVLIGLLLIIMRLAEPQFSLLYSNLDYEDAGRIMQTLDSAGIPYEVKGNGTMIFAPDDQVLKLRMDMASQGIPRGSSVGYEIFDKMDALGTTSFVQNINRLRALEGELARTVASLKSVTSARVHLVIPERSLFGEDTSEPSASIVVGAGSGRLMPAQVQAIQNLVASAVPRLSTTNVSVIDESGNLLTSPAGQDDQGLFMTTVADRTATFENRLRTRVENIVERIVGPGAARVQITADLDFNRIVQQSETFDPDSQVARSTQTVEESASDSETAASDGVSVEGNLPDADLEDPNGPQSQSAENRLEEVINYEISRTTKTETIEGGRINRLSVAVVVDGSYTEAADGSRSYAPRSQDEMDQIRSLVQSAIGYDQQRGDLIEVVNLQFAQVPKPDATQGEGSSFSLTKEDFLRIGEIAGAIIVGILLLLVFRSVMKSMSSGPSSVAEGGALSAEGAPQLTGPDGQPMTPEQTALAQQGAAGPVALPPPGNDIASRIDIAQIEGRVQESSIKKVGELVNVHPEESLSIVRTWMQEA